MAVRGEAATSMWLPHKRGPGSSGIQVVIEMHSGEVEIVERFTGRQTGFGEMSDDASAAALGNFQFGERGKEARVRGGCVCEGIRRTASSRAPVLVLKPALAAALRRTWVLWRFMYNLACWSVICVPGTGGSLPGS
jgi:hypothetical protein